MKQIFSIVMLVFLMLYSSGAMAQYKNEKDATIPLEYFYVERQSPRRILSKLIFGLSTGIGRTNFRHQFEGFQLIQNPNSQPLIYQAGSASAYSNWFNRVETTPLAINGPVFDSNAEELGFVSKSFNIPLRATVHVEFNRYRIGGGYSFDFTSVGDFKPLTNTDQINPLGSPVPSFFLKKYFASLGASLYRYNEYLLVADINLGGYRLGKKFDKSLITRGLFFNLGVTVEREMSEYFKLFVRPSYDIKGFSLGIPETGNSIRHRMNAFYINAGVTYRLPEVRRCFLKTCRAQITHAHGNKEYRSRAHPVYKKQNPHYGENYPVLIKYKGKNKKKLNPY